MYTQPDTLAEALIAVSRALAARKPAWLILDGESVTIADADGLIAAYGNQDGYETVASLSAMAPGDDLVAFDAVTSLQTDTAEALRWLAVWHDPELA